MDRMQVDRLPDAYERLLLDVIKGDKQNFVRTGKADAKVPALLSPYAVASSRADSYDMGRSTMCCAADELREAWRIFTPLLKRIEDEKIKPEPYPYGSQGPDSAYSFIQGFYSYHKEARYQWQAKH